MKKILFLLAIAAMALGVGAQERYDFKVDGIYYSYIDGEDGANVKVTSRYTYEHHSSTGKYKTKQVSYRGPLSIPKEVRYNDKVYTVREIDYCAFCNCTGLTWLTLPESIKYIGAAAINNCGSLRLDLPKSIQELGGYVFEGTVVENTQVLELPDLYTLNYYALYGAPFKKVILGGNMWRVRSQAFANSNIETIEFLSNDRPQQRDERLHFFIKGLAGFKGTEIRFPNRVFSVSFENIADCPNLERVYFPPVERLGHSRGGYCWYNESGAEGGGMGDGPLEYSSNYIIARCPNLKEVICYNTTPPGFYEFGNIQYDSSYMDYATVTDNEDCVLKVPAGSEDLYRLDPVWGHFKTIEGFEPGEYTGVYEVAATETPCEQPVYYKLQGQRIDHPQPGHLYIRKQGSQVKKMVY